jgi:hypothetical protein
MDYRRLAAAVFLLRICVILLGLNVMLSTSVFTLKMEFEDRVDAGSDFRVAVERMILTIVFSLCSGSTNLREIPK